MRMFKELMTAGVGALAMLSPSTASAQAFPTQPNGTVIFFDYFLFDNAGQPAQNLRTFAQ